MNGLFKEIYRGKSLLRTLMNLELKNHSISGKVLDVGGGVGPSYYRFLTKEPNTKVVTLDLEGGKARVRTLGEAGWIPWEN